MTNSSDIKIALIHYLRYSRRFMKVASEVGYNKGGVADILASDGSKILEIEIKCTKNDFLNDFKKSTRWGKKHNIIEVGTSKGTPNQFCFCVPDYLEQFVSDYLSTRQPKYGLWIYRDVGRWEERIRTVITPKFLHKDFNNRLEASIINRMSSEIAITYRDFYKYREDYKNKEVLI